MKKNLLIIPGFGESTIESPYNEFIKKNKKDFNIVTYNPVWDYYTASRWLHELKEILHTIDTRNTTVVAFSLGAYITLLAAETWFFKKIILCSISPFFKEQLYLMPKPAEKFFGIKRMRDFSTHLIPKNITCSVVFLFGTEDWSVGINEAKKLSQKYKGIFDFVPNAQHELTDEYIRKVSLYIK